MQEPIAVIGSACRFAGDATSASKLWELLQEPHDLRAEIPDSRFSAQGFYHPNGTHHGHTNVKHSYLINRDPSLFDAEFFGIKPVEAKAIDPQQRMLMEVVYEGLETAGIAIESLRCSNTGVYVGVMCADYEALLLRDMQNIPTYLATGIGRSILSNRISYFFDWHGPSITLDTACSSSLVAIHMAVQSLRSGESRVALACGSNLILGPENYIFESKLNMLSPDGLSRMWDRDANGYARGDGVAAVVLKTLSAAISDGDHIECVIRETGVNQDGATTGITMPSATAQEALIRETYAKAGLNLGVEANRPQFFEAHGTGTPAGDPIEAQAIRRAFYGDEEDGGLTDEPLYVGSIKTVLGHTEGTAGIAALMKASLALQNSCIPPNLHFNQLSDRVAPFYKGLEIARTTKQWPKLPAGQPRRASVNSFGFGGTNAHAIVESFEGPVTCAGTSEDPVLFTPFLFSASSEQSLRASLSAYATFLAENRDCDIHDLAWTLRDRRSLLSNRVAITARSICDLGSKISAMLNDQNTSIGTKELPAVRRQEAKILGIFTGQGAQYARMGAELIEKSPTARRIIQELDFYLAQLPGGDRPSWSLQAEILAGGASSRVHEAAISQPLCAAVQILLIDMLRLAKVKLHTVVGHSSGEIGAAYAAGYLTARDAIIIAYYRGFHTTRLASSPNGDNIKGAMIAVGTSMEDAKELCEMEEFVGRLGIAASNSSSSTTISGDEDAIAELQIILEDEKKFNRRLKVDKAYHSKHMLPCFEPYVNSVRQCGVKAREPSGGCAWFSSVYDGPIRPSYELGDVYWAENMTRPVLFSQAVTSALSSAEFDAVLEVGPHPALKGPASQTIEEVLNTKLPYQGTLSRNTNSVEAISTAFGNLLAQLGRKSIDLDSYEKGMIDKPVEFHVVKGLPTYQWNHASHWHESRVSRKTRLRKDIFHPLLGHVAPDSAPHNLRWRNLLRGSEIEWLSGHQVQGQTVFPAAGYVASALEASRSLAGEEPIRLIELRDFTIHQAVAFSENDDGIEVLISLTEVTTPSPGHVKAKFTYSAALGSQTEDFSLAASGNLKVHLGRSSSDLLPQRAQTPPHLISVDTDLFYTALAKLGYNFSGRFRSLTSLTRKHQFSTCMVNLQPPEPGAESFFIHPSELDAAFQSIILAYSYPNDDQLLSLHLPTSIEHIRVNPALCNSSRNSTELATVDAMLNPPESASQGFSGNVSLYMNHRAGTAIQVQGVKLVPLRGVADAEKDRKVFSKTHWVPGNPDGVLGACDTIVTQEHHDLLGVLERISAYYLRQFDQQVPRDDPLRFERPTSCYLDYARYITSLVETGKHRWAKKEWLNDTLDDVMNASNPYSDIPDVKVMHLVGQQMPRVFRGETNMLEQFRSNNVLDDYYAGGFGLLQSSRWLGRVLRQITERYPRMSILEIGAGTGGATKSILRSIGHDFSTYTFTDVSAGFFENAATVFADHKDQMIFKVLDAERDPLQQGYEEGAYDLVVASFIIHATAKIEHTMRNLRKLLKPGGFLVVGEGCHNGQTGGTGGFIFGPLPGWWLGVDEGRTLSPFVSTQEWDNALRNSGFSGIDTKPPTEFEDVLGVSLFVSQAVDEEFNLLRQPLLVPLSSPIDRLFIIGGSTSRSSHLVKGLEATLKGYARCTRVFKTLADVDYSLIDPESCVISLTELDNRVFEDITPVEWQHFKKMFETGKTLLWITSGRLDDEPFSNMTIGFGRTAVHETPDLRLQYLDISEPQNIDPRTIAECLLRLWTGRRPEEQGQRNYLWSVESELIIDAEGRQLIPRLRHLDGPNDRYNSGRRPRIHEVDISQSAVSLKKDHNGFSLTELPGNDTTETSEDWVELRITRSVSSALKTPVGQKFLVFGVDTTTGKSYVALVPSASSPLKVYKSSVIPCQDSDPSDGILLTLVAANLVSMAIIDSLFEGQTLVVHNPSSFFHKAISLQASAKGINTVFAADSTRPNVPNSWIQLVPYANKSEINQKLPRNPSCFVGLSSDRGDDGVGNEPTIMSMLPDHCRKETTKTIFSERASEDSNYSPEIIGCILQRALVYAQYLQIQAEGLAGVNSIDMRSVLDQSSSVGPMTIIDWKASTRLPVHISRLDSQPMFKGDKTYWMVGLSGALGISLCDWAIGRGARHLILTSRNPKVAPEWVEKHRSNGVNVSVMPCDVTDEARLNSVHRTICETYPPIIGVLNGAMVLRDVSIRNMSFEQMSDVVRPKVLGSIHLDRIFRNAPLDFFICFSSINCIIGNLGQANYSAANTFMCALAAQRRKRGVAGTALNVGAIIGAGYMERESSKALDLTVSKMALMHLSEEDFHQLFAEGIKAGHPGSPSGPELSTGLLEIQPNSPEPPRWLKDPRFAHFIVHESESGTGDAEQGGTTSIKDQLMACCTQEEVEAVIKHAFAAQLRNVLQMTKSDDELMPMRSNEIGLDSLISVDIRTWFLKIFQVSIPVLKIMGNDTMSNLARHAAENVPQELLPGLSANQGPSAPISTEPATPASKGDSSTGGRSSSADRSSTNSIPDTPAGQGTSTITTPERAPSEDSNDRKIDWEAESRPPAESEWVTAAAGAAAPTTPPRTVVLTGASGLLGHHLLNHMLENTSAKIICIAVRQLEDRLRSQQLPRSDRIVYYEGDLRKPRLGLSEQQAAVIFSEADVVIHNGSDTSHLKYYQSIRSSNVEPTQYLLSVCLPRKIPVHYVSSVGVGLFSGRGTLPAAKATDVGEPPSDGSQGYMASKWTCERMLERANELYGLQVWIHRPSTIIREGEDAEGSKAQMDWVNALLHYARILKAVPRVDNIRGALDLVYVKGVCADIIGQVMANKPMSAYGASYMNEVGDIVIPLDRLDDIGKGSSATFQTILMAEWTAKAIEKGLHPAVAALIEAMDTPGASDYPKLLRGST
ncbi:hypothetical protein DL769_006521 [Monosporascus sp. CRB-8-3]|nr:hypothetical protein DL769_006521 [Monosporascus sp. CRB-8-3]